MRRQPLALAIFALALISAGACLDFPEEGVYACDPATGDCTDAGVTPPGHGDGGTTTHDGGGTDAGLADAGHPAVVWCEQLSEAVCDFVIECDLFVEAQRPYCPEYVRHLTCLANASSAERGFQQFDAAAAAACLAKFKAEPVIDPVTGACQFPGFCNPFSPNAAGGQLCAIDEDCLSRSDVCAGQDCARSCQAAGRMGQPCNRFGSCDEGWCDPTTRICQMPRTDGSKCQGDEFCGASSYCDGCSGGGSSCSGTCTALPAVGKPCRMDGWPVCAPEAYCDWASGLCAQRIPESGQCTGADQCVEEAYCNLDTLRCTPRGATGVPCTNTPDCIEGLTCVKGKCGLPLGEGQSCLDYDDCDSAQSVSCDQVLRTCLPYQQVDAGQPCTNYSVGCNGGFCEGAATNPDGGVGTQGTCRPIAVGDPCFGDFSCGDGQYCGASPTGLTVCTAAGPGTPCSNTRNCLSGFFCGSARTCAPQRTLGQPCSAAETEECQASVCRVASADAGTGVCGAQSETDGGCVREVDCPDWHACANGSCVLTGILGAPCEGGQCLNAACERASDGGFECVPRLATGVCDSDGDCASGSCNAVCAPICQ